MTRFLMILVLAFSGVGRAEVTAAWKVPIGQFVPDHENNAEVRKLEKPPGESGFFQQGDELWDVSKVLMTAALPWLEAPDEGDPKKPWKGEWAVWNARSGMLVARGDYIDMIEAQQACGFDDSKLMVRMKFELVRGAKTHAVPVLAASGEQGRARVDDIVVETDASTDRLGFHDVSLVVSWNAGQTALRWGVYTSFAVRDGKRILVARHGTGNSAWELHVTAVGETIDGSPLAKSRWIEVGTKRPRPWPEDQMLQLTRHPLKDGLYIAAYQIPPPFMSGPPPVEIADMKAPATLRGWIHGSFQNAADKLKIQGFATDQPGFFAGVELRSNQLILVADAASHGRVAALLNGIFAPPDTLIQIESRPESGNYSLLAGYGGKALIDLVKQGELVDETRELFQIQPTLGDSGIVDLEYGVSDPGKPGEFTKGTAKLKPGEWQEIEDDVQPQAGPPISLRATVLDL